MLVLCAFLRFSGGEGEKKRIGELSVGLVTRAAKHLIDKHAFWA